MRQVAAPVDHDGSGGWELPPSRTAPYGTYWVMLVIFIALSVAMTWPMSAHLGDRVLGAPAPGDSFEYVYKTWWFKHALFDSHVSPFLNPDMFYPFGYDVTLSETTLSNTITALPLTVFWGEVVSYNLMMWLSFVLSGLGMYLLVRYLTGSRSAALLSGVAFAFCPYRMAHLGAGHLPLMGTQWLPLLLLYLDRMILRRSIRDAILAALFFTLGSLSAWYYAYMFSLAGGLYVLLRGRPWRHRLWRRDFARCVLAFGLVSLSLLGPLVLSMTRLWQEGGRPQSLHYVDQFSASPLDFLYPNVLQPLWGASLLRHYAQNVSENILYLGLLPSLLTGIALWRHRSGTVKAFAWLSLIFAIVALGTSLHWENARLYIPVPIWLERAFTSGMGLLTSRLALYPVSSFGLRQEGAVYLPLPTLLLYLYLPFFRAMRVWARFGLITMASMAVLSGYGLQVISQWRSWQNLGRFGIHRLVLSAVVVGLVAFEFAAAPYALGSCSVQARPVDFWLASQEGDWAIMEFPVIKAMTGRSLYVARTHGKKISFGYGTFFPRAFSEQRQTLEGFPSPESIALLRAWGVRYVLVGAKSYGSAWPGVEARLTDAADLKHVLTLDDDPIYAGDRLLRLLPGTESAFIVDRIHVYEVL